MHHMSFTHVTERDIDLLLLEEFTASPDFLAWFLTQVGLPDEFDLAEAHHSVTTSNGETDLLLVLTNEEDRIVVLIEDKIDAAFQPNQSGRYTERAQQSITLSDYTHAVTVIIAPASYFGDGEQRYGFDARLTYEQVLRWFAAAEHLGVRRTYKVKLLRTALERRERGWQLVPDEAVTVFWHAYWHHAREYAPDLAMPTPREDIPAGSSFIHFRPGDLPSNVALMHKVIHGNIDLQFAGMGDKLDELQTVYGPHLSPDMTIEQASRSGVVRIRVPPVDITTAVFDEHLETVNAALDAARKLHDLYRAQA